MNYSTLMSAEFDARPLLAGRFQAEAGWRYPNRKLWAHLILYVLVGTLQIMIGEECFSVVAGDWLLIPAGTPHSGLEDCGRLVYDWCYFYLQPDFMPLLDFGGDFLSESMLLFAHMLPMGADRQNLYMQILKRKMTDEPEPVYARHLLSLLLLEHARQSRANMGRSHTRTAAPVRQIQQWIEDHVMEPLTVAQVAEQFNYNADYLSSLFRRATGSSLKSTIIQSKLKRAKHLLLFTTTGVSVIAAQCGFADEKRFYKLFRQYVGISPLKYRKARFAGGENERESEPETRRESESLPEPGMGLPM